MARFEFASGELRGTQLTLYRSCLVHRGGAELETLPLAAIASLRVAFERDDRKLGWGAGLVVLALVLLAIAAPLSGLASHAVADLTAAGGQGVARALVSFFHLLEALASLLPVLALACALGGAALAVRGWQGATVLTLGLSGFERAYASRGRDALLLDFAEAVNERLMVLER